MGPFFIKIIEKLERWTGAHVACAMEQYGISLAPLVVVVVVVGLASGLDEIR